MNYPAAELRGIKGVFKAILYWKGTRRFPFQTNPFLVFHPAAELRGILLIKFLAGSCLSGLGIVLKEP